MYHGRFAPSPTGRLHAGSLIAALVSWLRARQANGQWLLRVEDIDPPREVNGAASAMQQDLARLGLLPDAPVLYQSTRDAAYQEALDRLRVAGHVFPCWCSRSDLADNHGRHLDGHCVTARDPSRPPAYRLRVPDNEVVFDDVLQGRQVQNLRATVGDFVLRRADGLWAYQLACVVDDAIQGVTEVVRGMDILDSTARQIHLQRLLGLPTPRYLHLPLVVDAEGRKLSKSDADHPLAEEPPALVLRSALALLGVPMDDVQGDEPSRLLEHAVARFDVARLARENTLSLSSDAGCEPPLF
ncbi:MAG TPA: tRNA glutamyl-Q(34) synthetase GluQRS [Rhodanobacteraceae bacterium]|nr:tRNA glutamyl-Q(34) synthetase GluQRS [Rhodanobacteraceae bacterium]